MNRNKHRRSGHRTYFFWHYVIRFLFIGILTAGMLIPSYYMMVRTMEKNAVESLDSNLEERFQKCNSTLGMLAGQARLASNEISVIQVGMARELDDAAGRDQYELSQARKWFHSSISQDDLLANAYMLSQNNPAFVSGSLVTTNGEEIYGSFYEMEGYTREEWRDAILAYEGNYSFLPSVMTNGTFSPTLLDHKEPIIHMIVPISDYGIKSNQVMVYMLNTERLFHDIFPMADGSFLCLKDENGTVLAVRGADGAILSQWPGQTDPKRQESGEESGQWEVLSSRDKTTGLEAVLCVPQQYFDGVTQPARRMTVCMAGGILLLVAILSFFMAARHSTSESRTMYAIEKIYPEIMRKEGVGAKGKRSFGDYVLGTIRMLDEKQKDYNERLHTMQSSLKEALLEKMVRGEIQTERDVESCRDVLNIQEDFFCCIYLRIVVRGGGKSSGEDSSVGGSASDEEQKMVRQVVLDSIRRYINSYTAFPCFYRGERDMEGVFILCLPGMSSDEKERVRECLKQAASYVENHVDVQICMGIGEAVQGIQKIAQSAKEARKEADQENKRLLLGQEEARRSKKELLFSAKSLRRMSVLLASGERDGLEAFFSELEQIIGETELSDDEGKQMFYAIRSVLDGIARREGKDQTELPCFEEQWEPLRQLKNLRTAAGELCERMREKQERAATQKRQDVIRFIQENFSDSNLCAAMVADRFGVTEKYVFQIVRDCTGKSLGDLIKEIRFAKAEELLAKSVDINKIPDQIGFNSLNTFYKAFKRNYGISPGQWRELCRNGQTTGIAGM